MKLACLLHHDWNGCRCRRCGVLRDQQHDWEGCRCRQCGQVRDEQHDLATGASDCKVSCRRCGWHFGWNHDWEGCVCRRCGTAKTEAGQADHEWQGCGCRRCDATRHAWDQGCCKRCGERCQHVKVEVRWSTDLSHESIRGLGTRYCCICGLELGSVPLK